MTDFICLKRQIMRKVIEMNIIDSAKERQIGVDLYKILCCFLITTIHLFGYSDFLSIQELTTANYVLTGN